MSKPASRVDDPRVRVYKNGRFFYHFIGGERLHRKLWIEKNGPIPSGMLLVCKNGDTMNPYPDNWELLTPQENLNRIRHLVHNLPKPRQVTCTNCSAGFETSDSVQRLCPSCSGHTVYHPTCLQCGQAFETTKKNNTLCSESCQKKRKMEQTKESFERNRQERKKVVKRPKVARQANKPLKAVKQPKLKEPKVTKRKTSAGDKRGVENVPVGKMFELNRNAPKNDREIIKRKGIESPDVSQMFKHYDKRLRITRFFPTQERYEKFLQTQNQEA